MTGQSLWVAFGKVGGTGADRAGKRVNEENRGGCIGLSYRKIGVLLSVYFSDLTRRPVYIDKALLAVCHNLSIHHFVLLFINVFILLKLLILFYRSKQ